MKQSFSLLFILAAILLSAQDRENISAFNMMSVTYKHNEKWSLYGEGQLRAIEDYAKPDYYEVKGGIGYNINKQHQPFIGIGKYGTYKNSKFYQNEFRIWLQYVFSHNLGKAKIDHRARAEKRFFDYPQTDTKSNTERYRYRLTATYPLNRDKLGPGTLFVNGFEELFFGPDEPAFKRNRLFGGFGYQFSKNIGSNLGYMWQREFALKGNTNLHFLYFALNFSFTGKDLENSGAMPAAD